MSRLAGVAVGAPPALVAVVHRERVEAQAHDLRVIDPGQVGVDVRLAGDAHEHRLRRRVLGPDADGPQVAEVDRRLLGRVEPRSILFELMA